ncbi:stage V sporulation protein K [Caldalkalibacillus salinus]|uniref:stage V sporulation protein K n=1 Tax=Caldalkalibacillus salinus TaxID=2803787 RepID=UPI001F026F8E|nr:stage V sporulation protein K [Caldalkalibacillus salinus]
MTRPVIKRESGQINVTFPTETTSDTPYALHRQHHLDYDHHQHLALDKVMNQLDRLVGLKHVKDFVYEIYAWLHITQQRQKLGLKSSQQTLHMVFKGNPGTGKTTVARILGHLFQEMNVLSKGHLVEVERADLVGEYIGHTAQKTRELVKKALGGILFIDEAYSLARGGTKDFGKEAIDCLVKAMEDHKDEFVLILAGYPDEMDYFLASNPGLPSRFPIQLSFKNYTVSELLAIAELMVCEREYQLSSQAKHKIRQFIAEEMRKPGKNFSNARMVRNLIEKAIREHAVRLLHHSHNTKNDLMTLSAGDFVPLSK